MQNPKVSVIIPVYNAENTVGNILEKLISQEYRNIEIIIVNDGSTDSSWKTLQKFAKVDSRVIAINQMNAGASAARNVGIMNASGKFVTFIDSDDDISGRLICELMSHVKDDSDFIMCGMSINDKEMLAPNALIEDGESITRYVLKSLLTKNLLYGPYCKLFRRSIILDNAIQFPEDVKDGEDTIFVLNYLRHVRNITNIQQALYNYNLQPSGLASTNNTKIAFRRARTSALNMFMRDSELSIISIAICALLKVRWLLAFVKCLIGSKYA